MITSLYPVLICDDVAATASFFRDCFDLEPTFESDWYVSLRIGDQELAVLAAGHETLPAAHRTGVAGPVLVNIETDDVDELYLRNVERAGRQCVQPLRSEEFGQRHFILVAPGGVLVDVIQPIAFSGPFAEVAAVPV